jgi:DNA-binding response OmpR family regulator
MTTSSSRSSWPSCSPGSGRCSAAAASSPPTPGRSATSWSTRPPAGCTATAASIDLTRTEFDLLVQLGRHPDRVLSKTQLLASVWGFDSYDVNVVEVHISALRRKLEEHGPRIIHTVRGAGYRLRPPQD